MKPKEWIEFTDDESSWPEDGRPIAYWFEPFEKVYIGKYYRSEDGRRGTIVGQLGFCEPYEATHWMPITALITKQDIEDRSWPTKPRT
jgi:hypothetical protein